MQINSPTGPSSERKEGSAKAAEWSGEGPGPAADTAVRGAAVVFVQAPFYFLVLLRIYSPRQSATCMETRPARVMRACWLDAAEARQLATGLPARPRRSGVSEIDRRTPQAKAAGAGCPVYLGG